MKYKSIEHIEYNITNLKFYQKRYNYNKMHV